MNKIEIPAEVYQEWVKEWNLTNKKIDFAHFADTDPFFVDFDSHVGLKFIERNTEHIFSLRQHTDIFEIVDKKKFITAILINKDLAEIYEQHIAN
jgi:hypothetical protein